MNLHRDLRELLAAFGDAKVEYLVIGGYAVSHHATPRFTKDLDLLLRPTSDNRCRAADALAAWGAPGNIVEALRAATPEEIVWLGQPPLRVDLLLGIPGVAFDEAYPRRAVTLWSGVEVSVIGRADLISAKRAAGRPQDLVDAELLEGRPGP